VALFGLLGSQPERALPELRQAIVEIRATDAPRLLTVPLHNLGDLCLRSGELGEAADAFREALRLCVIYGPMHQVHLNRGFLGYTLARMGDVAEGARMLDRARRDVTAMVGSHITRQQLRMLGAEVAHMQGHTARARRELEEMAAEFRGASEHSLADMAQEALVRIEREALTAFGDGSAARSGDDPDRDTVKTNGAE
jgi:hypothetical protein